MILDLLRLTLFPVLMIFAAFSDLFTMTISNRVSIALVAGFFIVAMLGGMPIDQMAMHVAAGVVVLVVAFGCFAMGWMGGGDAKVAASVAVWFGFSHLAIYLIYASLFGGVLTLALLQFRQFALPMMLDEQPWIHRLHNKDTGIPYGIALAIGALMIYPETEWIKSVDLAHFAMR